MRPTPAESMTPTPPGLPDSPAPPNDSDQNVSGIANPFNINHILNHSYSSFFSHSRFGSLASTRPHQDFQAATVQARNNSS